MGGTGVIDRFLEVFTRYIDSGFGLLQGEVKWLAGVLIAIDLVLAALFWAMAPDEDVIARLTEFAAADETITGVPVGRVEVHIIRDDGTATRYPVAIPRNDAAHEETVDSAITYLADTQLNM